MGFPQARNTPVYDDDIARIEWGNHIIGGCECAKHIDIRNHFAHETIKNRLMRLIKVDTSKQLADVFTKALEYQQFISCFCGILGNSNRHGSSSTPLSRFSAGPSVLRRVNGLTPPWHRQDSPQGIATPDGDSESMESV